MCILITSLGGPGVLQLFTPMKQQADLRQSQISGWLLEELWLHGVLEVGILNSPVDSPQASPAVHKPIDRHNLYA